MTRLDHASPTEFHWQLTRRDLLVRICDEDNVEYLEVHVHDDSWPLKVNLTLTLLGTEQSNGWSNKLVRLYDYKKSKNAERFIRLCELKELKENGYIVNDAIKIRATFPEQVFIT